MMQDGKALQAGTSHFLGQNFAKAFEVKFADKEGKLEYVWATSWGVSTRLMGALIMTHSDDEGLVLPPALAPIQVVAVPIYRSAEELEAISVKVNELAAKLKARGISFKFDDDDNRRPGWKFAEYESKGVPVRVAIGPRDLENGKAEIARRDTKTKETVDFEGLDQYIDDLLNSIQQNLLERRENSERRIRTRLNHMMNSEKKLIMVVFSLLIGMEQRRPRRGSKRRHRQLSDVCLWMEPKRRECVWSPEGLLLEK
jgi:prolyl-tRNA synthetase